MTSRLPRLLAMGAAALVAMSGIAWLIRGPAIVLDLMWLGCL